MSLQHVCCLGDRYIDDVFDILTLTLRLLPIEHVYKLVGIFAQSFYIPIYVCIDEKSTAT